MPRHLLCLFRAGLLQWLFLGIQFLCHLTYVVVDYFSDVFSETVGRSMLCTKHKQVTLLQTFPTQNTCTSSDACPLDSKFLSCITTITSTATNFILLHFTWGVAEAKCILVTAVCVSVCPVPHSHTTVRTGRKLGERQGCPLVVHYWADLQLVHGFCCSEWNTVQNATCQGVLVLAECLVLLLLFLLLVF